MDDPVPRIPCWYKARRGCSVRTNTPSEHGSTCKERVGTFNMCLTKALLEDLKCTWTWMSHKVNERLINGL